MNIIFMGTPIFAVPSLKNIIQADGCDVKAVVTQPDRKKGRGQKSQPSPVKKTAQKYNLPVLQSENINQAEFIESMQKYQPDFIVVVAFGQKLAEEVLNLPKFACINLHASLLPKYRGASPIHQAIINGDKLTGNTTMYMGAGWDNGDIIYQQEVKIKRSDNVGSLHDKLAIKGAQLLVQTLEDIYAGQAPRQPQVEAEATYAGKIDKSIGEIDWHDSAEDIFNLVRGVNPWPGAFTYLDGKLLKIWRVEPLSENAADYSAGQVVGCSEKGIIVKTGNGLVRIAKLQLASRKKMDSGEFVCGYDLKAGKKLG